MGITLPVKSESEQREQPPPAKNNNRKRLADSESQHFEVVAACKEEKAANQKWLAELDRKTIEFERMRNLTERELLRWIGKEQVEKPLEPRRTKLLPKFNI